MDAVRTVVQVIAVEAEESGRKLFSFLRARLGPVPERLLLRLVRTGQVRIDGKRCKPFDRVQAGQQVRIPPLTVNPSAPGLDSVSGLEIMVQTADMLVVNKPAGLPVHPGSGWTDSVQTRLRRLFADQAFTPVPVHRLDRDTSGLLLCARTHVFLRTMHAAWPSVTKAYVCWVEGCLAATGWQSLVSDMGKTDTGRGQRVVSGQGRRAVSHIHVVHAATNRSLVLVVLGTGRTHQIRVHLADLGHPLQGDPKYGHGAGLLLHAVFLSWPGQEFFLLPTWEGAAALTPEHAQIIPQLLASAPVKMP